MDIEHEELALKKFQSLVHRYSDKKELVFASNEAKTRLLLIDEILQILGWGKQSFNPETYVPDAGYLDYLLKSDGVPKLVVEAKKSGITFRASTSRMKQVEYEVRYFRKAFKRQFSDVIDQARKYCIETKTPYAILTNGVEWIAVQLITFSGISADSAKGVYFGNIFSDDFGFDFFWNLLSKNCVEKGALEEHLAGINYQASEVCKVLKADYSSLQWKNEKRAPYLNDFYEHFFSQITESNQRRMLEYCFVTDSKLEQYRGELKRLLKDEKPNFLPNSAEDLEPGEGKSSILNESKTGQVVIITGSVGCGKSTLVMKCLVEARQSHRNSMKPIYIDLINEVNRTEEISARKVLFESIYEELLETYEDIFSLEYLRKVFAKDIAVLKNGEYQDVFKDSVEEFRRHEADLLSLKRKNSEEFVLKVFKHFTSENKSVILIIDNVDRAHEKFQEDMYALSHKISSKSGAKTIITLREFTFFRNKTNGFLDVRPEDKVIHLKAPDFERLISKRIKYIQSKLDSDYRIKEWRRRYPDFENFISNIREYAEVIKSSIQTSQEGHNIIETLSSVSWHNIRYFYELMHRIHRQLACSSSLWTNDEVIAALMSSTEVGEKPILPNIFIPYKDVNQAYFLKLRLIAFLSGLKPNEVTNGVPLNRIVEYLKLYGYQRIWICDSLVSCVSQRLIECLEIPSENEAIENFKLNKGDTYRLSPLGLLYLNHIIKNKTYQSLISVDLPLHSLPDFEELKREFDKVSSYMTDEKESLVFKEGLDIILNSKLSEKLKSYLYKELGREQVISEVPRFHSEAELTERIIDSIFSYEKHYDRYSSLQVVNDSSEQLSLGLFSSNDGLENNLDTELRAFIDSLDYDFDNCSFEGSEFIPLIFCALRLRQMEGVDYSSGAEITRIINDYLVSDSNRKFPNNVSRALRSRRLLSQPWLERRTDIHKKNKMFALTDKWEEEWSKVFAT